MELDLKADSEVCRKLGTSGRTPASAQKRKRIRLMVAYSHKGVDWLADQLGVTDVTVMQHAVDWGVKIEGFDPETDEAKKVLREAKNARRRESAKRKKAIQP